MINSSSHFTPRCAAPRAVNFRTISCIILHVFLSQHDMPQLRTPITYSCKLMYFWAVTSTSYDATRLEVKSVPSASTLTRPSPPPTGCTILVFGVAIGRAAQFDALQDPEQFDSVTRTTQPNSYQAYRCPSRPLASSRSCRTQPAEKNYFVTSDASVLCVKRVVS